ncbi:MAG: GTPase ObgE [Phycisphaerae bacterium]|mgnify:CR=1 FL=1|jgi:GTPase|nr:GTPase ObgE [Phycisphaerae bacterium]MBT5409572.1 GTPase ObgE [Phycisphaerae bacterium]MBT6165550.1 GTPase ObgE [Phycisphaerae bacterium]MBT7656930.1 GTPase ObgE [Phycisphaerae bacterium]
MLVDRARIFVRSGKGGDGCMSFRREKYIPKGGPNGGDGGDGGDVILVGDQSIDTLLSVTHRPHYRATHGIQGKGSQLHGANGSDCIVKVPLGTLVHLEETGELLVDIAVDGQELVVAKGGKGGWGNEHFKSATNQTPRETTAGAPIEEHVLNLELKLIADIGLVGMPNAGKSTLLSTISAARPKIADYPFTTLQPHLGIADVDANRRLVVADIPGLIEGAAEGAGLGHRFLKHIERTGALLHLVDVMPIDGSDPVTNYRTIRDELENYSTELAGKDELVVLNKIDLLPVDERDEAISTIVDELGLKEVVFTSSATREGISDLLERSWILTKK